MMERRKPEENNPRVCCFVRDTGGCHCMAEFLGGRKNKRSRKKRSAL